MQSKRIVNVTDPSALQDAATLNYVSSRVPLSFGANTWFGNDTGLSAAPGVQPLAALTKTDDTNVTVTLGGTPATALAKAVSVTLGWTGTLAVARGGTGLATAGANTFFSNNSASTAAPAWNAMAALTEVDDTNVTLTLGGTPATALLKAVSLTLGWTGLLAVARGGTGVGTSTGSGSNVLSASPTFTGTALFATINPTNITGTNTNDNAAVGAIGETVSSTITFAAKGTNTNNVARNVTSISLTAGDWDVQGCASFNYATLAATSASQLSAAISQTSATIPDDGYQAYGLIVNPTAGAQTLLASCPLPRRRISLASTTTIYLVSQMSGVGGTLQSFGFIQARRVR